MTAPDINRITEALTDEEIVLIRAALHWWAADATDEEAWTPDDFADKCEELKALALNCRALAQRILAASRQSTDRSET